MSTKNKNLSNYNLENVPSGKGKRFGMVVSEWNREVTFALRDAAIATLKKFDVPKNDIEVFQVPGAFELTLGAQWLGEKENIDAVICIGCVVKGETPHFEFICQGIAYGITALNISLGKPIIFSVLTTNSLEQAIDRSGGIHGNKGDEGAITALKMLEVRDRMKK